MIKPRANTWLDIVCRDPFFTDIKFTLAKTSLLYFQNMSEMGCRKELGTLPSVAGLIILPSSGVGASGRCPKTRTLRRLPVDAFRESIQCLNNCHCYRAVHKGPLCPTSPCKCPCAALSARDPSSHARRDKFLVLAGILKSLRRVMEFKK